MFDYWILDENGNQKRATCGEWSAWIDSNPDRHVGRTTTDNGYYVSTVFLTCNQAWDGGPPVLWETMIFGGAVDDSYQERYTSRVDAEAGHARAVEYAKGLPTAEKIA